MVFAPVFLDAVCQVGASARAGCRCGAPVARRSSLSAKTESDAYVYLLTVFGSERVGKVQSGVNGIVRRLAILAPLQLSGGH